MEVMLTHYTGDDCDIKDINDDDDDDCDDDNNDDNIDDTHSSGPTSPRRRSFNSSSEAFSSVNPPTSKIQCNPMQFNAMQVSSAVFSAAKGKTLHCSAV